MVLMLFVQKYRNQINRHVYYKRSNAASQEPSSEIMGGFHFQLTSVIRLRESSTISSELYRQYQNYLKYSSQNFSRKSTASMLTDLTDYFLSFISRLQHRL